LLFWAPAAEDPARTSLIVTSFHGSMIVSLVAGGLWVAVEQPTKQPLKTSERESRILGFITESFSCLNTGG